MLSQAKEKHCDAWQLRNHFYFAAVMETAKRQPNEQWDFNSSRRQELCPWTCPHLFESITRKAGKKRRKESRNKIKTGHIHRFLDIYKIESCSTIFRDKRNKLRIWPNNRLTDWSTPKKPTDWSSPPIAFKRCYEIRQTRDRTTIFLTFFVSCDNYVTYFRLSEKFLSFDKVIIDEQEFLFYIILLN